jgi:hypothetical protein
MTAQSNGELSSREKVALGVIILSGAGIAVVAVVAIWAGTYATTDPNRNLVMTVFNTLIPMFGTWVGTVIAFYFSRENFATATTATRELVSQFGDDRLRQIAVKDAWIPVDAIEAVTVGARAENTISFDEVKAKLSGRVSRIPVWDQNKVVRYVIHESMIYRFLAAPPAAPPPAAPTPAGAPPAAPPPPAPAPTLQDFLNFTFNGTTMRIAVSRIAWISQDSTLAAARDKMTSVPDCQDVFVTATGQPTESVLGWLTNADIAKKAKA